MIRNVIYMASFIIIPRPMMMMNEAEVAVEEEEVEIIREIDWRARGYHLLRPRHLLPNQPIMMM